MHGETQGKEGHDKRSASERAIQNHKQPRGTAAQISIFSSMDLHPSSWKRDPALATCAHRESTNGK